MTSALFGFREARLDHDLGPERAVDGAVIRDLQESMALLLRKRAAEVDLTLDPIETSRLVLALFAVSCMDLPVAKADGDALQRPIFPSRVHRERDRRAGAERRKQEVVRRGPAVRPSIRHRLVAEESMRSDRDLLCEAAAGALDDNPVVTWKVRQIGHERSLGGRR